MTDNGAMLALTASATKVPLPDGTKRVRLQNLGPNIVYYGSTAAKAASTLGTQIAATTGTVDVDIFGHELYVQTVVADQTGAAGVRWFAVSFG